MTLAASSSKGNGHTASPLQQARQRISIVPITVEQYQKMIEQQIVPEDSTIELLRGVLVRKDRSVIGEDPTGHSPLHMAVIALLTQLTAKINSELCHLRIQGPIVCRPDSDPEPDGAIIRGAPRDYLDHLPLASTDVTCVIEAAHSSLDRDRDEKLPLYAANGVPQYIIINLQNRTLEIYTDPDPTSEQYRSKATRTGNENLSLLLFSRSLEISASEILP
jgi:Uma2 family endonuclease